MLTEEQVLLRAESEDAAGTETENIVAAYTKDGYKYGFVRLFLSILIKKLAQS
jgi:hypothetical protein